MAAPNQLTITNLAPGDYTFSVRAFDTQGARTWSAPVRVSVLAAAPILNLQSADADSIAIHWPQAVDNFYLESAPAPSGPWSLVNQAPLFYTTNQTVIQPPADQQFFRLMRPR